MYGKQARLTTDHTMTIRIYSDTLCKKAAGTVTAQKKLRVVRLNGNPVVTNSLGPP